MLGVRKVRQQLEEEAPRRAEEVEVLCEEAAHADGRRHMQEAVGAQAGVCATTISSRHDGMRYCRDTAYVTSARHRRGRRGRSR